MTCTLINKESMALVENMSLYFKEKPPDCSLFSQDNFEFPIHKEVLFQTNYLCKMIQSTISDPCCCKIEIFCPSIAKEKLQIMVDFLYSGRTSCDDKVIAIQACENLNKMFGFPINVINNQLVTDEKSKLVKTEKETICDINMVIFCYFN